MRDPSRVTRSTERTRTPQAEKEHDAGPISMEIPRWQKEMDDFIAGIPPLEDWDSRRQNFHLATLQQNKAAIKSLVNCSPRELPPHTASPSEQEGLALLAVYFEAVHRMDSCAAWCHRINQFMDLIAVSWCEVLVQQDIPLDRVDDMMKKSISMRRSTAIDSSYLKRLRKGVKWVNRCIACLSNTGWGHRASEIFLLCKSHVIP